MLEFEVRHCTRHCAKTGQKLQAGDTIYSVLVVKRGKVTRQDYAAEAWPGPPEDALGWWKSCLPRRDSKKNRLHWAPNDVMLDLLDELEAAQDQHDLRYVLALLLIRRRVVRLETTEEEQSGPEDTRQEVMSLYGPRNEKSYRVSVVEPSTKRMAEIQEELARLLSADAE